MITIDPDHLIAAMDAAASAYVNALAPDLPPLHWALNDQTLRGHASDCGALEAWAALFGLPERPNALAGTRQFQGPADLKVIQSVRLVCITDYAALDAALGELVADR